MEPVQCSDFSVRKTGQRSRIYTSTSSPSSSEAITSTTKCVTCAGTGFLVTCSTSELNFIGSRSSLCGNKHDRELATVLAPQPAAASGAQNAQPHSRTRAQQTEKRTFFLPTNELQSMLTPWLTMAISRLCSFRNHVTISLSVGSFLNSKRSHNVHSVVPYLFFWAAIGSEKPKNGRAKLTKPFL